MDKTFYLEGTEPHVNKQNNPEWYAILQPTTGKADLWIERICAQFDEKIKAVVLRSSNASKPPSMRTLAVSLACLPRGHRTFVSYVLSRFVVVARPCCVNPF